MKRIITIDDVRQAMELLGRLKKKDTLLAIRAVLGHHGSMTTITRSRDAIKAEMRAAAQSAAAEQGVQKMKEAQAAAMADLRAQLDAVTRRMDEFASALARVEALLSGLGRPSATYLSLACELLQGARRPHSIRALWRALVQLGWRSRLNAPGKTPEKSFASKIYQEAKKPAGRLERVDEKFRLKTSTGAGPGSLSWSFRPCQ